MEQFVGVLCYLWLWIVSDDLFKTASRKVCENVWSEYLSIQNIILFKSARLVFYKFVEAISWMRTTLQV